MTRRRWLLLGMVVAAAVLAAGLWLIQPPRSAINGENAAKIRRGMTLAEVEAILGGPPRADSTCPLLFEDDPGRDPDLRLDPEFWKVALEDDLPFPAYRWWV